MRWAGTLSLGLVFVVACTAPVATNVEDGESNELVTTLQSRGIAAEKLRDEAGDQRWQVVVPRSDQGEAVRILSREGLPRAPSVGLLDALDDGALVPSRGAEQARLLFGTAGELERSLRSVDGVVSARVHLAAEPKGALSPNGDGAPTASVLIRYRGARPPLPDADVRRLVAGAVAGLAPDRVNVVIAAATPAKAAERSVVRFGPISTTQDALPRLRLAVAAAAVLGIALATALMTLWARLRSLRARLAAPSDARR